MKYVLIPGDLKAIKVTESTLLRIPFLTFRLHLFGLNTKSLHQAYLKKIHYPEL